MSKVSGASLAIIAVTLTLVATPLALWTYQRSMQRSEKREKLKLLYKVENIMAEIAVRLTQLENEVEDFLANEGSTEPTPEDEESALNSYYHFDSQGRKLKTKWDSYDVDAELKRLEEEEREQNPSSNQSKRSPRDREKLLKAACGLEHEFEAVLEFLDGISGGDDIKKQRKAVVLKINDGFLPRVDHIRNMLRPQE